MDTGIPQLRIGDRTPCHAAGEHSQKAWCLLCWTRPSAGVQLRVRYRELDPQEPGDRSFMLAAGIVHVVGACGWRPALAMAAPVLDAQDFGAGGGGRSLWRVDWLRLA